MGGNSFQDAGCTGLYFTTSQNSLCRLSTSLAIFPSLTIQESFATSITRIYFYAVFIVIVNFVIVLFRLPELWLGKTNRSDETVLSFEQQKAIVMKRPI
jgi:hypothetical protein